jgi:hypothetical protein
VRAGRRTRRFRASAAAGVTGMLLAGLALEPAARADAPAVPLAGVPGAGAPVAGVPVGSAPELLTLPHDLTYRLSPQLAGMLGRDTIDVAGLAALRAALPFQPRSGARPTLPGQPTPPVGTTALWPALDLVEGTGVYLKPYTLRAVGDKIEVWVVSGKDGVSDGTAFPSGDCRNAVAGSTAVTDAQLRALVREFDTTMYPREVAVFGAPPDRPGTLTLPGLAAGGVDFAGDGDNTVTLIDNVRDDNFYDFPKNKSYIAGFYTPIFNALTDRNVMTIDAFDWLHRTGAAPRDEPHKDLCKSRPARPRAYEGVFAHEWQHLLMGYRDFGETTWINEGLSDMAITLTGYGDARRRVAQSGAQGHIYCFQGFGTVKGAGNPNPNACGGPQNSLTVWEDEGSGSEVLADYGNAWSFLLFLYDRYGTDIISGLHRDPAAQGLAAVQAQLDKLAPGTKVADVLHDYQLMNLLDRHFDVAGGRVAGIDRARVTTRSLDAAVNLANPASRTRPGAAPNGADYVLLRADGRTLRGADLRSVTFAGDVRTSGPGGSVLPLDLPSLAATPSTGAVANWHVSLVGLDRAGHRALVRSYDGFALSVGAADLAAFRGYPVVVAVVAHDDPKDTDTTDEQYAGYSLVVNGERQAGG